MCSRSTETLEKKSVSNANSHDHKRYLSLPCMSRLDWAQYIFFRNGNSSRYMTMFIAVFITHNVVTNTKKNNSVSETSTKSSIDNSIAE
jgi:hypothetical protein